jgi:transposase
VEEAATRYRDSAVRRDRSQASYEQYVDCGSTTSDRGAAEEWAKPGGRAGIRCAASAGIIASAGERSMTGLPSLQALDSSQRVRIWLASEATDMRCGFDRLTERVRAVIGQDPLSGHWFAFRSRGGNRLKILHWDRDGYALWYKRLEKGSFKLPRGEAGAGSLEMRASELAMVLDGIDVAKLKRVERYERRSGTTTDNKEKTTV